MTYDFLVKKLNMMEKNYLFADEIRVYCKVIGLDYYADLLQMFYSEQFSSKQRVEFFYGHFCLSEYCS
jgi:hypothetical protein